MLIFIYAIFKQEFDLGRIFALSSQGLRWTERVSANSKCHWESSIYWRHSPLHNFVMANNFHSPPHSLPRLMMEGAEWCCKLCSWNYLHFLVFRILRWFETEGRDMHSHCQCHSLGQRWGCRDMRNHCRCLVFLASLCSRNFGVLLHRLCIRQVLFRNAKWCLSWLFGGNW